MAKIYARLIGIGLKALVDVPSHLKHEVARLLGFLGDEAQ